MNHKLDLALAAVDVARSNLREALKVSTATEGIIILALIGRTVELGRDINSLLNAVEADHK